MFAKAILILFCFVNFEAEAGESSEAETVSEVLEAFRGSCPTQGQWTNVAIGQMQALKSMLESLKQKDPCKNLVESLGLVGTVQDIQTLMQDPSYQKIRYTEEKLQNLTLILNSNTDPDTMMSLKQAVVETQFELESIRAAGSISAAHMRKVAYQTATERLGQLSQSLLRSSYSGLASCFARSPQAAQQMMVNVAGIAGSFISPVVGAASSVLAQFTTAILGAIQGAKYHRALNQLGRGSMPIAMSCGLESMTDLYCRASDSFSLLEVSEASLGRSREISESEIYRGIDLLVRRLPVLNQWVLQVRSGVMPSDPSEAQRQNETWVRRVEFENLVRLMQGAFGRAKRTFDGASDPLAREQTLQVLLRRDIWQIFYYSLNGAGTNSLNSVYDYSKFLCELFVARSRTGECPEYKADLGEREYVNPLLNKFGLLDPELFQQNFLVIADGIRSQIDVDFSKTISIDPSTLFYACTQAHPGVDSPCRILIQLKGYLESRSVDSKLGEADRVYAKETLDLVNNVLGFIEDIDPDKPSKVKTSPISRIQKIYKELHLFETDKFLSSRVERIVQVDIMSRLKRGELPGDVAEILRTAGVHLNTRLQAAGLKRFDEVKEDLNSARTIVHGNLETFQGFFKKSIRGSLEHLQERIRTTKESAIGANRPHGQVLGKLCILLLVSSSEWPEKDVPWKLCEDATYYSLLWRPEKVNVARSKFMIRLRDWKKEMAGNFQQRVCSFHRFQRKVLMEELMHEETMQKTKLNPRSSYQDYFNFSPTRFQSTTLQNPVM